MLKNKILLILAIVFTTLSFVSTLINASSVYFLIDILPTLDLSSLKSSGMTGSHATGIVAILIFLFIHYLGVFGIYLISLVLTSAFFVISSILLIINILQKYKKNLNTFLIIVNFIIIISESILFIVIKYNLEILIK